MTPKQRMLTVMRHGVPDRVPVAPDMSNMIPARLTGKPFWDIYLYQDPPLWKAYIDAVKYFGFDGFLDYQVKLFFADEIAPPNPNVKTVIVERTDERIVTRTFRNEDGKVSWYPHVSVFPRDNPPTYGIHFSKLGLPETPEGWEPIEGVKQWPQGEDLFALAYEMMGDSGVVGTTCGTSVVVGSEAGLYQYMDDPEAVRERSRRIIEGSRLVLKGNLHTVEVMLNGSYDDVFNASRQAIADGGEGGSFILSTGDQCGRDTPDGNIRAMIDAAEQFGRY